MTRMVELAPLKLKRHLYQKKSGNLSARLIALLPRRSAAISCSMTQAAERLSRLSCFPVRFSGSLKRLAGAFGPKPSEMAKAHVPSIKVGCRSRFGTIGRGPTSLASNRGIDT